MSAMIGVLPWNPEAAVEPGKQAVLAVGRTGGRVSLFVARHFGPEAWGGFLTPGQAEGLADKLRALAAEARAADAPAAEDGI